jgi:glycosyltransferase involved in cell wall biosynthesis
MSLQVTQLVETTDRDAGSMTISVAGLVAALRRLDVQADLVAGDTELSTASILNADVIHIHGWGYEAAHRVAKSATRSGRRFVVSPQGGFSSNPVDKAGWIMRRMRAGRDRRLLRGCRRILATHFAEAEDCRSRFKGLLADVLPYGIDVDSYGADSADRGGSEKRILLLAPLHPVEGGVVLLKAMAELGRVADGWSVVLAGREVKGYRAALEAAVRRKGAEGRVRFELADDEVAQRQRLSQADILACPALCVGRPVSLLQGAAAGLPVIASPQVTPDESPHWLRICPPTRAGLVEGLSELIGQDDVRRREIGAALRTWAVNSLDWSVLAPRYAELYRDVSG